MRKGELNSAIDALRKARCVKRIAYLRIAYLRIAYCVLRICALRKAQWSKTFAYCVWRFTQRVFDLLRKGFSTIANGVLRKGYLTVA